MEELALSAEGATIAVASCAVTMAARGQGGNAPCVEQHHIATICNDKSTARGDPWTPQRYHQIVCDRLRKATRTCRSVEECRSRLTRELGDLAKEIATPDAELNQLITRNKPI